MARELSTTLKLRCYDGQHDDLVAWAEAIRANGAHGDMQIELARTLRAGIAALASLDPHPTPLDVDLSPVMDELRAISRKLDGVVLTGTGVEPEPEQAALNLDGLFQRLEK